MVPVRGVKRSACCCLKGARAIHLKITCVSSPITPLLEAKQIYRLRHVGFNLNVETTADMCMKQHPEWPRGPWGLHEDNTNCQILCSASVQSEPPQHRLIMIPTITFGVRLFLALRIFQQSFFQQSFPANICAFLTCKSHCCVDIYCLHRAVTKYHELLGQLSQVLGNLHGL